MSTAQKSERHWRPHTRVGLLVPILALLTPMLAIAAERDICENKSGQELIRCIEAAARSTPPPTAAPTPKSAPAPAQPAPAKSAAAPPSVPSPKIQAQPAPEAVRPAPEDCTGKTGETLRRCLAAGGRLAAEAAIVPSQPQQFSTPAVRQESCDGKSGEELRRCVEASAKAPQTSPAAAQPQVIACTGFTAADQPLCLHRNTALVECRNRQKYPDFDVCLRSFMVRAPQPARADCTTLQARSRTHCENRNQAFQGCLNDKFAYFACLEQKLGADARLTRR